MNSHGTALDLAELESAAALVHRVMPATAQYPWPKLGRRADCRVWVKHENHTPTGAFKVRGGLVYLDRLRRAQPACPGVITATRGNHGQSIAFSAARSGIPATIYVPRNNSGDQNSAIAGFGARVIEFGKDFDEAKHEACRVASAEGLHFVPSFHRDLVAGVATYALELFRSAGALDAVYVGVGMGSGINGLIAVRDLLGLKTEIIGVCAAQAPATALSFAAGRPVSTASAATFIDGVACRVPDPTAIAAIVGGAARIVEVSEDQCAEAVRVLLRTTHNLAEPAGAIALAGLLAERDTAPERVAGRRVGVVLSGGNLDAHLLATLLAGHTPHP